ncbi:MAG: hypothetical protein AAFR93_07015, partial [Pseudomonadota bacterium]
MDRSNTRGDGFGSTVDSETLRDAQALEPRMMFDGAAGAEAVDELTDQSADVLAPTVEEPDAQEALAIDAGEAAGKALYIIDGGLDDVDTLVAAVPT